MTRARRHDGWVAAAAATLLHACTIPDSAYIVTIDSSREAARADASPDAADAPHSDAAPPDPTIRDGATDARVDSAADVASDVPDAFDAMGGSETVDATAPTDAGTEACVASIERCNGVDDDCNGQTDEGFAAIVEACNGVDDNCNGQTDEGFSSAPEICNAVDDNCNGQTDEGFAGIAEVCNQMDDNCDGQTDEGLAVYWYPDGDADSYGTNDTNLAVFSCAALDGYSSATGDCDDGDAAIHPLAAEVCNGTDDDCDMRLDEGTLCVNPSTCSGTSSGCCTTTATGTCAGGGTGACAGSTRWTVCHDATWSNNQFYCCEK